MTSGQHAATFAAHLRDLKSRTDRSYGSLARRLGMNTSTLHRYCAGEAVPQDFAPVERLAGFCGASPAERLELHRLWLLAVEERQGRGRREEGAEGAEGVKSGADLNAGGGVGDGAGAVADAEAGVSGSEGEGGAGAGAGGRGEGRAEVDAEGSVSEASPGGPGVGETDAFASSGSGAHSPSADDPVVHDAVPARARPWYRRRAAVFGAVACVVAATVGTLAALPDGRRDVPPGVTAQGGEEVPGVVVTPGGGSPSASAAPSGSPGASGSPSPSPSAKGASPSPGGNGGSGGGGSASPSAGKPSFAGTPLTWTADSHVWANGCAHYYVVDRPPAQVPPPPMSQDARAWAAAEGALHGKETMVRITVQGRSETAVVLEALRVRVVTRTAPAPGNAYATDQGCGGSLTPREFAVDLDKDRPIARSMPGNDAGTVLPAVSFPYRVSAKDPEVLLVSARTAGCDCSWYLELDWSSQGRTGTVRIDDAGTPFRTTAIAHLPRYEYDTLDRGWRPREY
ncbi:helix-turn-helix domain-containing protein [Streptomyces roseirectus]|uniref:helix-turn-helix domain-containing protein n=1 Tax=Streptomyces roseirectus TaxID=2768066 RepID=UPI001FE7A9C9|nr:helix-turn-helix transcriptional regulator [Streptomyces roseirectus]